MTRYRLVAAALVLAAAGCGPRRPPRELIPQPVPPPAARRSVEVAAVPPPKAPPAAPVREPPGIADGITPQTPPHVAASLRMTENGRQRLSSGDVDGALDELEQAIKIDPSNAHGYYWLAQVHYRRNRYDQAVAFADKASVLFGHANPGWLSRSLAFKAAVYEAMGRPADAQRAYAGAVAAEPGNLAARAGLARTGGRRPPGP